MKTTIRTTRTGSVELSYDDAFTGERVTREFFCSDNPSAYVREYRPNGNNTQPCQRLERLGNTLMSNGRAGLLDVIRREYRAMRRAELAEQRQYA